MTQEPITIFFRGDKVESGASENKFLIFTVLLFEEMGEGLRVKPLRGYNF